MGSNQSNHHHNTNHHHHSHHHSHNQHRRSLHNIREHGLFHDSHHHGRKSPKPFEPEEEAVEEGWISAKQFHNYFYDGFYAPYILNPVYMLLIDCRDEESYNRRHIVTAHWHGSLDMNDETLDLSQFSLIMFYDEDGSAPEGSIIRNLQNDMAGTNVKLEPVIIQGGFAFFDKNYPYMTTKLELTSAERQSFIHWYPSIMEESTLYLGRAEHALSIEVIESLGITHVVNLTPNTPNIFPSVSYLCFPVTDSKDASLRHYFTEITKRIEGAISSGGRVLVHCDQGVNAGPTVIIAYLMHQKLCTLEDAHYYVKSLRPIIQPSEHFMEELSHFECELFGRRITSTDDLWF